MNIEQCFVFFFFFIYVDQQITKSIEFVFNRIAKTSKTVLKQAECEYLSGDEEMAYVYYMKYFQLIGLLKSSKTYEQNKAKIREILGSNTSMSNNMDRLGSIKNSLLNR